MQVLTKRRGDGSPLPLMPDAVRRGRSCCGGRPLIFAQRSRPHRFAIRTVHKKSRSIPTRRRWPPGALACWGMLRNEARLRLENLGLTSFNGLPHQRQNAAALHNAQRRHRRVRTGLIAEIRSFQTD